MDAQRCLFKILFPPLRRVERLSLRREGEKEDRREEVDENMEFFDNDFFSANLSSKSPIELTLC